MKNAIEAIGIPHTEVASLVVNGVEATLDRIVRDSDSIEVFSWSDRGVVQPAGVLQFVADAHLGGLARFLRMLGFDTTHHNALADEAIRRLAQDERRIVLTRDRELLKCREIASGCFVGALKPAEQLREVAARFGLAAHARPFTLCLRCNLPLTPVDKSQVLERLPQSVAQNQHEFCSCRGCGRIYWPGSHYARMRVALQGLLGNDALVSS